MSSSAVEGGGSREREGESAEKGGVASVRSDKSPTSVGDILDDGGEKIQGCNNTSSSGNAVKSNSAGEANGGADGTSTGTEIAPRQKIGTEKQSNGAPSAKDRHEDDGEAGRPPNMQTITITAEDLASQLVSTADPWVPRIRNNDEYLQRGLDFAPGVMNSEMDKHNNKAGGKISPLMGDLGATRLSEALFHNTHLLYLNLSGNDIGIEGGTDLAKCLYSSVGASNNNNNNSSRNSSIRRSLNSSSSSIRRKFSNGSSNSGEGGAFESKTALRVLNLSDNNISSDGAIAFAWSLQYNTSLKELNLSNNGISSGGVLALLGGLEGNKMLKRLLLLDNAGDLTGKEISTLAKRVGKVLRRGCNGDRALEVLEMHCTNDENDSVVDNLDGISEDDAWHLRCAIYGSDPKNHFEGRLKNHRFRTLTLPTVSNEDLKNDSGDVSENHLLVRQLRRILKFNAYYHPIMQLNDILDSPLARAEAAMSVPLKLPDRLRRGSISGALIGLLPSEKTRSVGVDYRLMPRVLAFACGECTLETAWNLVRYRPDVFCCAGRADNYVTTVVECAACFGDGCCVS